MRKLKLDALRADMNSVNRLLTNRTELDDPVGYFQFKNRQQEIQKQIAELKNSPELKGSVALFFSGNPVVGSKGIRADFAGRALEIFQEVVSKQFASEEIGDIHQKGPVPLRTSSDLLITDIARGSVGFVLEEAGQNDTFVQTQLSVVLQHVGDSISITTAPDAQAFDDLLETLDQRQLKALRSFFEHLDAANATMRLVEGDREVTLSSDGIRLARERTSAATIEEHDNDQITGRLYLLPGHRRFELHVGDDPAGISGSVAKEFARDHLQDMQSASDVVGKLWRVRIQIRTIRRPNGQPKLSYTLKGLIEKMD